MALLTVLMSAYFVGRSVEYTIIIAFLPFVGIATPAILQTATGVAHIRAPAPRFILAVAALAGLWAISFTLLALLRHDAPYSLFIHECRDHGRCSPSAIFAGLREKLRSARPVVMRKLETDGATIISMRAAPLERRLTRCNVLPMINQQ